MTGPTDAERLSRAFRALDAAGVIAREDYGWGRGDGPNIMYGEREEFFPGARGFVHDAIDRGPGLLFYGVFTDEERQDPEEQAALGREVVEALRTQGLEPSWDGSPRQAIELTTDAWKWRPVHRAADRRAADGGTPALLVNFDDRRLDNGGLVRFSGQGMVGDDGVWRELLYRLTPARGSYLTFITPDDTALQLIWEEGPRLRVEVPDPEARVYHYTHLSLAQAEQAVAALAEDGLAPLAALRGSGPLETESWDA
ncbi:DUF6891 domain-containing protein [Nocardiopsis protaetiae]|uniref:DUF6891 domain-containing protein n=1 Tax=Nocardiopsis protaetiae TaxID=3382270 RepID=UPI00387B97D2